MTFEVINGTRIGVDSSGTGEPTLIFAHGGCCDRRDWSAQVRALSPQFRVVTFDLPGHGESTPPRQISVTALAEAVAEVKSRYGGDHSILVGHSLSCRLIIEALRLSPRGIVGLVFIDNHFVSGGSVDQAVEGFRNLFRAVGVLEFLRGFFAQMFTPKCALELQQRTMLRLEHLDPKFAEELLLNVVPWDTSEAAEQLARVNVPVLILQSTALCENLSLQSLEPGMTVPWTELVMQQIPRAELQIVPGVGHFAQIEAADTVSASIRSFAQRVMNEIRDASHRGARNT